jgi:hypothetical protein
LRAQHRFRTERRVVMDNEVLQVETWSRQNAQFDPLHFYGMAKGQSN